ncbi:protein phosphatase 1 regulatory subunit 36 isoform X2 [Phascolarctos cinereus]|uniref:Protein phosphatase 1 regulatory subunit 36 isoform X2 n=1 Tax=Phascolarctos cinereus TaxID=38626 RepID=A0A6P5LW73_PHACI|nr:protein phosphatase 1 regulatory subunit 36 isoform X2 [Phascolarctos cinereus]
MEPLEKDPEPFEDAAAASAAAAAAAAAAPVPPPRPCIQPRCGSQHQKAGFGRVPSRATSFKRAVQTVSKSASETGPGALPGRTFLLPQENGEGSERGEQGYPSTLRTPEDSSRKERLNVLMPLSPPIGRWYWDDETNTLKLKSPMPASETKEKLKKGKSVHFIENDGTASERLSEKRFSKRDEKSTKRTDKQSKNDKVTLDDAKYVALFLLQDTEMQRIYSFTTFMRNEKLDEFLMALLYYLSHYLEKLSLEKKPKSYMTSHIEKKEMELVMERLQESQKYLAQKYCILILGLGMPDKHHMACGKEKISDTQKDWKFFEAFFTFCTYVAWVVFRREYLTEIDEEIGRLFRTNMFNSARRRQKEEEVGEGKRRTTFVQFRKMMAKLPAIKTTIRMRSPALSTLLPSPKEHAQHLFEKTRSSRSGVPFKPSSKRELISSPSVVMPVVGILGEPRSLFNTSTLLPREQEQKPESTKRNASLIIENNAKVQETLELAMKALSSSGVLTK